MKNTKEMIEVMQAFVEGKEIECKCLDFQDEWEIAGEPAWSWSSFDYQIKPMPKYRPWKADEVPVGSVIVHKSTRNKFLLNSLIREDRARYYVLLGNCVCSATNLWDLYEMADGTPCGVKE